MTLSYRGRPRFSFWAKAALTLIGAFAGDWLLYDHPWGSALGGAALAWAVCAVAMRREILRDRRAIAAGLAAAVFALVLADRPGPMAWVLFWTSLTLAVLLPRAGRFDDAWRWFQRLVFHAVVQGFGPLLDALKLGKVRAKAGRLRVVGLIATFALPLAGGAIFLALFRAANPIIAEVLANIRLPDFNLFRAMWIAALAVTIWGVFRPRRLRKPLRLTNPAEGRDLPGVTVVSVTLSLIVFNALFALQNGLDIAFLWSGARLPGDLTMAEYAHRGAYPLIATALLAGLFVLVALRPGSATARDTLIRRMVGVWVAQNVFLVASSALRTLDYIEAYSLTRMRIAALAWMGLVAVGLILICWRLLRGKSAAWLINANALAAALVLAVSSIVDFGSIAAAWNVRHAREVGGRGVELDLCYLDRLGDSALVPLAELDLARLPPPLAGRVRNVRQNLRADLETRQLEGWGWTWRGQRRLQRADVLLPRGEALSFQSGCRCACAPSPLTSPQPS